MAANCHIPNASTTLFAHRNPPNPHFADICNFPGQACLWHRTNLRLAPPCICCLQMGQSQASAGAARGFWPCLRQNRLPINFTWINLTAELGILPYFLRLSLAHLPSGRAGTNGWHQTVIFPSLQWWVVLITPWTPPSSPTPSWVLQICLGLGKVFVFRGMECEACAPNTTQFWSGSGKQTTCTPGITATLRPSWLEPVHAASHCQGPGSPGHISEARM